MPAAHPNPAGAPTEARYYAYCYGSETDLGCRPTRDESEAKWFCQHGGLVFFDGDKQFVAGYGFTSASTEVESDSPCLELQRWAAFGSLLSVLCLGISACF